MATLAMVPLEEYLDSSYSPDCEWVDGQLRRRAVGEGSHAYLQTFFIKYFLLRETELAVRVTQELRTQVSPQNYRVPDVVVMRSSDPYEEIVRTPPLLCIEVLSPTDTMSEMHEKIEDYLRMGILAVWVVDPRRRSGLIADRQGTRRTEVLEVPGTVIRVTLSEVFAELDRLEGKAN